MADQAFDDHVQSVLEGWNVDLVCLAVPSAAAGGQGEDGGHSGGGGSNPSNPDPGQTPPVGTDVRTTLSPGLHDAGQAASNLTLEYSVAPITGGTSIYRSGDSGATWTKVKTWANAKHGHAVKAIGGVPWVMLGDYPGGFTDIGLWSASDAAAGLWTRRSRFGEESVTKRVSSSAMGSTLCFTQKSAGRHASASGATSRPADSAGRSTPKPR